MSTSAMFRGLARHCGLSIALNFRSPQAVAYGYVMPILFLLAFGGIFRGDTPLLSHEMGQLITITVLGGACFGMPTGLVADRERGLWRRYRLLPVPAGALLASTACARLVLLVTAAMLQVLLARVAYGTPLPLHPVGASVAFLFTCAAFLGVGLLVAAVADDVPAVQALGQCLFLPMIMLGGVGVPLSVLPGWAQFLAGFMPGRYAVESLQRCFTDPRGLSGMGYALASLAVIGAAGAVVGVRVFRWDAGRRAGRGVWAWVALALAAWLAVGVAAASGGRLAPVPAAGADYASLSSADIGAIGFDDLPGDDELATRLSPPLRGDALAAMAAFRGRLEAWEPGRLSDPVQSARNILSVAAVADITANPREGEIARCAFDLLQGRFADAQLRPVLAWIVMTPGAGTVVARLPELGIPGAPPETVVRQRVGLYARKLLGRLEGRIRDTGQ